MLWYVILRYLHVQVYVYAYVCVDGCVYACVHVCLCLCLSSRLYLSMLMSMFTLKLSHDVPCYAELRYPKLCCAMPGHLGLAMQRHAMSCCVVTLHYVHYFALRHSLFHVVRCDVALYCIALIVFRDFLLRDITATLCHFVHVALGFIGLGDVEFQYFISYCIKPHHIFHISSHHGIHIILSYHITPYRTTAHYVIPYHIASRCIISHLL